MDHQAAAFPLLPAGSGRPRPGGDHKGAHDRIVLHLLHCARCYSTELLCPACHLSSWCSSPGPSEGGGGASSARGAWWWYRSSEHTHTSCSCWCALAIHQQPMVRAHLDVAIPVPRGAPPPQHQPAAMFTGAAPPLMPPWTPPAQPSPPQPWSGGWDQAALA